MYTPKQPEAHSSQSQWLTWQSAWQPLCTLETALRLIPALSCRAHYHPLPILYLHGVPHFPLPNPLSHMPKHIWHPRTKPSISANQSHYDANGFGNKSAPWNWHTMRSRKYCPLTLNFLNKNDRRGESSLCEWSPLDWSKYEKREWEGQCRVQTHIQYYCNSTAAHKHTKYD